MTMTSRDTKSRRQNQGHYWSGRAFTSFVEDFSSLVLSDSAEPADRLNKNCTEELDSYDKAFAATQKR